MYALCCISKLMTNLLLFILISFHLNHVWLSYKYWNIWLFSCYIGVSFIISIQRESFPFVRRDYFDYMKGKFVNWDKSWPLTRCIRSVFKVYECGLKKHLIYDLAAAKRSLNRLLLLFNKNEDVTIEDESAYKRLNQNKSNLKKI